MSEQYISDQVQRTLRVMRAMAGYEVTGISPTEIAKLAKTSASNVTRVLANLEAQRFVERLPNDNKRFRLAAAFVQIANTVTIGLTRAAQQLDNDSHNYNLQAV
jgi:DNA-binding IclR family transcriptional regulator